MSEMEQAEKADDGDEQTEELTKTDFFERLTLEGATLDGSFFMPYGEGRQRRYFRYDPGLVKGFDAIRDDDGDIVAQQVANHEEAMVEQVSKDDLEGVVLPKMDDGFGSFGIAITESAADEGDSESGGSTDDYEPMDDDEVLETIRRNYDEHGLFVEVEEDGETKEKVVSLAHPDARPMGYITGSHVKSLPSENLQTVDDYRNAVYQALGADLSEDDEAEPIVDFGSPDDVPVAPEEMLEKFREAGGSVSEEQREKLSRQVKKRWEEGSYDHLRKDDEGDE